MLCKIMQSKARTTLYIDKAVVRKAQSIGLNVSRVAENALVQSIKALEGIIPSNQPNTGLRARGLAVRISPLHGEGRRFESGRAH